MRVAALGGKELKCMHVQYSSISDKRGGLSLSVAAKDRKRVRARFLSRKPMHPDEENGTLAHSNRAETTRRDVAAQCKGFCFVLFYYLFFNLVLNFAKTPLLYPASK